MKNLDEIAAKRVEEDRLAGEVARCAGELAASRDRHSALIRSWYLHSAYALASALSTLSGLASSGRLVGVISHVAELKGRIDRQILVEKGRADGSTVRVKC